MSTKNTYKQTEVGLIPEDWEVKKLGNEINILGGNAFSSNDISEEGIKWLKIANVGINKIKEDVLEFLPFEFKEIHKDFLLKSGDYVMALTRPLLGGKLKISKILNNDEWLLNQRVAKLDSKVGTIEYYINYFKQPYFCYQLEVLMAGTDPPNLSLTEFKNIKIPVPPLPEQKKIADCLSTWDVAIEKQSQLINALTDRKKALMQQLLTGKKRLPGFSDEWKEVSLIELADFRRGSFPQPYGLPEWYDNENGEPFIQVYDVGDNFNLKPTTKSKISELAQVQSVFIKKGTLIVTLQGSIGKVAITNYDAYIDRTLLLFSSFKMKVDIYFIMYQIHNLFNIEKEKAPGGIIKTITKEVLSNFKIKLPSFEEQTAIAEILATADRELQLQKEKLAQLQTQKKGLMQVLLTGKKRLIN